METMKELNVQALEQTSGGVVVIVAAIGAACIYLGYKAVELGIDIGKNIYDLATDKK